MSNVTLLCTLRVFPHIFSYSATRIHGWPSSATWLAQQCYVAGPAVYVAGPAVYVAGPAVLRGWPSNARWLAQQRYVAGPAVLRGWPSSATWLAQQCYVESSGPISLKQALCPASVIKARKQTQSVGLWLTISSNPVGRDVAHYQLKLSQ